MKRKLLPLLIFTLLITLATMPLYSSDLIIQLGINALIFAILAQSWNIIGGYTGYPSFGNSVFYGLGCYGVALAMLKFELPFAVGLICGSILALIVAFIFGLFVLRLKGHYFAIATLSLTFASTALVSNIDFAGGNIGLVLPIGPSDAVFFELSLGLLSLATATVFWIEKSRFGLGLIAIRENELAAESIGIHTTLYKILSFMLSSLFASLAGGVHTYWITFLDPDSAFDITLNVKMIIMTLFGGPGTVFGPLIGAFFLSIISEILAIQITSLAALFFGFIIVIAILFMPRGVIDFFENYKDQGYKYFLDSIKKTKI